MSKIILAEDDPATRKVMLDLLTWQSDDIYEADSNAGLLELMQRVRPDVFIINSMLKDGMTYPTCRAIRRDPRLYKSAILFVSAIKDAPEIEYALEQGGDNYIMKPVERGDFLQHVTAMKRLVEIVRTRNPVSNLPGLDALRREINHHIFREERFALCYVRIRGIQDYRKKYGARSEQKVTAFMAKLIPAVLDACDVEKPYIAHIGAGHFMVLLDEERAAKFGSALVQSFDRNASQFDSALTVRVGVIHHGPDKPFTSPSQLFDHLNRLIDDVPEEGKSILVRSES